MSERRETMNIFYVIAIVLVILWFLGLVTASFGNLIHILLGIAILVVLLRIIRGRRPLGGKA